MDTEQLALVHDALTAAGSGLVERIEGDERQESNSRTCRWPLFEGHEPFHEKLYCGARTSSGSHYCAAHAGRAFK
jgi:hypothetical protein